MADPYAERGEVRAGDEPAPASPFSALIRERGGVALLAAGDLPAPEEARFLALPRHDEGLLPPLARPPAALAAALLYSPAPRDRAAALEALRAEEREVLLVKDGLIAGPPGSEGCAPVTAELLDSLLEAEGLEWDRDPDFGWELPLPPAGLGDEAAELLCPRLRYAAGDRVYEYAELVAATKRRWCAALGEGAPAELAAAIGWPPQPTGTAWKD
jgi:hypothetical protein